ncbi:MAG TPA: hypothetical protein VLF21_00325 [Candidatus Saccharimonadales bacterium]|nr:hypothetical protein [Candidatus Saccharimonadales bacterium]
MKWKLALALLGLIIIATAAWWLYFYGEAYAVNSVASACQKNDGRTYGNLAVAFNGKETIKLSKEQVDGLDKTPAAAVTKLPNGKPVAAGPTPKKCGFTTINRSGRKSMDKSRIQRLGVQDGAVYKVTGGLSTEVSFVRWHGSWHVLMPGSEPTASTNSSLSPNPSSSSSTSPTAAPIAAPAPPPSQN